MSSFRGLLFLSVFLAFVSAAFGQPAIEELQLRADPEVSAIRPYESIVLQVLGYGSLEEDSGEKRKVRVRVAGAEFRVLEAQGGWLSKPFRFQGPEEERIYEPRDTGLTSLIWGRTRDQLLLQDSSLYTAPARQGSYVVEVSASGKTARLTIHVNSRAPRRREQEKTSFREGPRDSDRHRDLAEHWAPFIAQATWFEPKADYLARFDFDGDWKGDNNWDSTPVGSSQAYVYYAVMETDTHWFLIYNLFHPRDYSDKCVAGTCHENDNEGLILTISKDGSRYGSLQVMESLAHNNIYSYRVDRRIKKNVHDVDGNVTFFDSSHPAVFVESGGHGVYGVEGGHSKYDFKNDRFEVGTGVTYVYKGVAERPEHPDDREVGYDLLPIYEHWWLRAHSGSGQADQTFSDYQRYQPMGGRPGTVFSEISGAFLGKRFGANKAKPFWGWHDRRTQKRNALATGQWGLDPAYAVSQNLRFPKPFSLNYLHNPYLSIAGGLAEDRRSRTPRRRTRPVDPPAVAAGNELQIKHSSNWDHPEADRGQLDLVLEVDEHIEVLIRGQRVFYRNIRGKHPVDLGSVGSQPLPASETSEFKVKKRDGRGRVRVLEEPSPANNYGAKLEIEDTKGGADRYHIRITWESKPEQRPSDQAAVDDFSQPPPFHLPLDLPPGEELVSRSAVPESYDSGSSGQFKFTGWVDHELLLRVQGDRVFAETVQGRDVTGVVFKFTQPIPSGDGWRFRIEKKSGRGEVTLVESPGPSNNFTAVVRVFDSKRGAVSYRFVLRWDRAS